MSKVFPTLLLACLYFHSIADKTPNRFTKNAGQVCDQFQKTQNHIAYYGQTSNLHFFLSNAGISYQLDKHPAIPKDKNLNTDKNLKEHKYLSHRVDFSFINANSSAVFHSERPFGDRENFIQSSGTFMDVLSYSELFLDDLYKGISVHYYSSSSRLKYDYLIAPGSDYKKIQIQINGAENVSIDNNGDLQIKTSTGTFTEQKPIAFQNGKELKARYNLKDDQLSFEIEGANTKDTLIIDPVTRLWGTYYGSDGSEDITGVATDPFGNVVVCGYVFGNGTYVLSTPGAYEVMMSDMFIAKFDSTGARLWCTYYGSGYQSVVFDCSTDRSGNIYVCGESPGSSSLSNNFTSPGSYQPIGMGQDEAFLLKLSPSGGRLWCTLYGSTLEEKGISCTSDQLKNVYLLAYTGSYQNNLSSPGAFLTSYQETILVKFDSLGNRLWATYYPGDFSNGAFHQQCEVRTDPANNVIFITNTSDPSVFAASPNAWQTQIGGFMDAVIAKFDPSGNRLWATYYGGPANDEAFGLAIDGVGNIYVCGTTETMSVNQMTSSGCHQSVFGGGFQDGFVVKFNPNGVRSWGTLYGGGDTDEPSGLSAVGGTLYGVGVTDDNSATGISMPPTFQAVSGGAKEGFIFLFDTSGVRLWASYYGGSNYDYFNGISVTPTRKLYAGGLTASPTSTAIASASAFGPIQQNGDGFITHFYECTPQGPINNTMPSYNVLCGITGPTLTANAIGPINWYSSATSSNVLFTGNTYTLPLQTPGTYTWYAESLDPCSNSNIRSPIIVTINATSTMNVPSGTVCAGQVYTILPQSTTQFTYYFSTITNTFIANINAWYSVTGVAAGYCSVTGAGSVQVLPNPVVSISSNNGFVCSGSTVTLTVSGAQNYTWGHGPVGSSCTVAPLANTIYSANGTAQNGCSNQSTFTQFAYLCNGIGENEGDLFMVYPNPAREKIKILVNENYEGSMKYQLCDAIGRIIFKGYFETSTELELKNISSGVYLLQVFTGNEAKVIRVVKE